MTKNQIDYWRSIETKRNNQQVEFETNRHNIETENIAKQQNRETQRHNVVVENETGRSNRENERIRHDSNAISRSNLIEQGRHNRMTEHVGLLQAGVSQYQARELARHNLASEGISQYQADTTRSSVQNQFLTNVRANEIKSEANAIQRGQLNESIRHNKAAERNQLIGDAIHGVSSLLGSGLRTAAAFRR